MWFDPGVGHVLPGEVLEYHRAANVLSVQAVIAGKVRQLGRKEAFDHAYSVQPDRSASHVGIGNGLNERF